MSGVSTIGVLGGMGPEATNRLCALITTLTPVRKDQDHIPVITFNNSLIPERVGAISGSTESPVPEMIRTARILEQAGADMLLMPCNLAHHFIAEVQREIRIPILNMIEETVAYTVSCYPEARAVGLLASTQTIKLGLYENSFARHHRTVLAPDALDQQSKVMEAIYGRHGIKSGYKTKPRALLMEAAHKLAAKGAQTIIAACTEVSLVLGAGHAPFEIVDPMEVLARVAVERARPQAARLGLTERSQSARSQRGEGVEKDEQYLADVG
jgi:aspartate racemase